LRLLPQFCSAVSQQQFDIPISALRMASFFSSKPMSKAVFACYGSHMPGIFTLARD
jgi:hypothetical protein